MIQFYAPEIDVNPVLPEGESQHCVKVLRMQMGDSVNVVDGRGTLYRCCLLDAHPKHALLEVVETVHVPLPWQHSITLAIAPTKHLDRMEWLVEKLVEIGINRIVPLRCRHSERKEIKTDRLEKIAVSAMKQSLKAVVPEISPMTDFAAFIGADTAAQRFVAYCNDEIPRIPLSHLYKPDTDVTILIGPEGDFSPEEVRLAFDRGYRPVTLGDNRLRTETAALYSVSAFHILDSLNKQQ